jgi:hypothetical protein
MQMSKVPTISDYGASLGVKNIIIKSLILQSAELNFVEEVETINKFLI